MSSGRRQKVHTPSGRGVHDHHCIASSIMQRMTVSIYLDRADATQVCEKLLQDRDAHLAIILTTEVCGEVRQPKGCLGDSLHDRYRSLDELAWRQHALETLGFLCLEAQSAKVNKAYLAPEHCLSYNGVQLA